MMKERREKMPVEDRPTEVGIKLNNILTFLVLAVMTWVGVNITIMKDSLAEVRLDDAVMKYRMNAFDKAFDDHVKQDVRFFTSKNSRRE